MAVYPRPSQVLQDWPVDQKVYLTLDFECDFGTALSENVYHAARQIGVLLDIVERHEIPLTVFLQTELLETAPETIERLQDADIPLEIHPHSHTHPTRTEADPVTEIQESVSYVRKRFETDPLGFRFPDGATEPRDPKRLVDAGVDFDASLFPTRRPGRFNNSDAPRYPFIHADTELVEIPFTVLGKPVGVPVSLSYLKLLGRPFEWVVCNCTPSVIVFDLHMHDLVPTPSIDDLGVSYQMVYARNASRSSAILDQLIEKLAASGYTFGLMSELYKKSERELRGR